MDQRRNVGWNTAAFRYLTGSRFLVVDQRFDPSDDSFAGSRWKSLGLFAVDQDAGSITVQATLLDAGIMAADAVWVRRVDEARSDLETILLDGNPLDDLAHELYLPLLQADVNRVSFTPDEAPALSVGHPGSPSGRVAAADFVYAANNVTEVRRTGDVPFNLTTDSANLGDIHVQLNGEGIHQASGILMASIRENRSTADSSLRGVEAYPFDNGHSMWLSITSQAGAAVEANAPVSAAYFPFSEGWIGGHVAAGGTLLHSSRVAPVVKKTGTGRYLVEIPGVHDSTQDGLLLVIGGSNGDNQVSALPLGGNDWRVAVFDNDQDGTSGEDGAFSFVYVPFDAQDLIAGDIDLEAGSAVIRRSAGEFTVTHVSPGTIDIDISNHSGTTGVLLLTNTNPGTAPQDNFLTYAPVGGADFRIQTHDLPSSPRQDADIGFVFVPFVTTFRSPPPNPNLYVADLFDASDVRGALLLDGVDDYVTVGDVLDAGTGNLTVEVSFSRSPTGNQPCLAHRCGRRSYRPTTESTSLR